MEVDVYDRPSTLLSLIGSKSLLYIDIANFNTIMIVLGAGGTDGAPVNGGLIAILIVGVLVLATVMVLVLGHRPA